MLTPEEIGKEAEIVNKYLARFIGSERGEPDENNQLHWHSAAVEVEAEACIQEIAMSVHSQLALGLITHEQATKNQTIMLEITLRSMFYAGFQMATEGLALTPCDCPRFLPKDQVKVTPETYRKEVSDGTREPGNYL
jgi:hypothetical protein